jgi:hypothetical protein
MHHDNLPSPGFLTNTKLSTLRGSGRACHGSNFRRRQAYGFRALSGRWPSLDGLAAGRTGGIAALLNRGVQTVFSAWQHCYILIALLDRLGFIFLNIADFKDVRAG